MFSSPTMANVAQLNGIELRECVDQTGYFAKTVAIPKVAFFFSAMPTKIFANLQSVFFRTKTRLL